MEKAVAHAISIGIVGFGAWGLVAGRASSVPIFWSCVALVAIAVGIWSACSDS
ncbi:MULTISPECIES: hypothetical protein [Bradyrhizobium]|uniref:hypothetical protein n=1 Tax=Bradyrhizobium centrosematis TaxID=1300039 RepID=UPI002167D01C|nr:hypothetical protein [Bradyrhizobium centrosematis]MCS3765815.1 hypothetical protein [Bradyrhizobium centrosematis]MCS3778305.1 hypothetical protein [Bradyrhizobium centrosematis]